MFSSGGWRLLLKSESLSWRPKNKNIAYIDLKNLKTAKVKKI
jgi:hypothetical protein